MSADIRASAQETVETLHPEASGRGIKLSFSNSGGAAWLVQAERSRLDRIFLNLIENALRHTPDASTVKVSIQREADFIEARVEDEGPGVPSDIEKELFKRLVRRHSGKSGLGLYFCRIMIEKWEGEIGYTPGKPRGACFWFRLPSVAV
jgi:signal transduction histidine kinase